MSKELRKQLGINEATPNDWFEKLYANSDKVGEGIPWANLAPHPIFKNWGDSNPKLKEKKTALVIGCGLGDDAIELESKGYTVTAFDVSKSAIDICKKRFPNSKVEFLQADLIKGVPEWKEKFDFVLEVFTIQALPPKYEENLLKNITDFLSKNGKLLVITEVNKAQRDFENGPPWLLNNDYIQKFNHLGLKLIDHNSDNTPEIGEECHLSLFERS